MIISENINPSSKRDRVGNYAIQIERDWLFFYWKPSLTHRRAGKYAIYNGTNWLFFLLETELNEQACK